MQLRPLTLERAAPRWPLDLGAVLRSLAGVLFVAAVALRFGAVGAATAAAGAAAIAGGTALQDEPRGPGPRVVLVSLAMGVAVGLGGWASGMPVVFVALVAVWCWLAGLMWTFSANTGLLATATAVLLVVAPPTPPVDAAVAAGLAVGGGLVQAVLIAVRPRRRWRTQRAASQRAYRSLGENSRALADDAGACVDPAPLRHLRDAFTLSDYQARRRPLAYRQWYGLPERIAAAVTAAAKVTDPGVRSRLLAAAADTLEAIAVRDRDDAVHALAAVLAAADTAVGPDRAAAQRLVSSLREAVAAQFSEIASTTSDLRRLTRADVAGAARTRIRAVQGQLDRTSSILRHAIRLAAAAAAGTAFARWAELPHGHWVALAVLLVLRPETAHTYTRCAGRIAGVLAGIGVASVVTVMWHPTGLVAAALAVLCLGLTYAMSAYGYIAVSAGLAAALVFLVDVSAVAGTAALTDRLTAAVIGGALAVLGHVLLPDDGLVRLRQRAGELLRAEVDYAAAVIRAFVHDVDRPADAVSAAWQRAFRSRAAFEAACGTTRVAARELRLWLRTYRSALNAVTASCTALENNLPGQLPATMTIEFVTVVDDYVDVLRGGFPDPTAAWTVDGEALAAANARVREVASTLPSDLAAARVLVAEIAVITAQLARLSGGANALP
ncbi:FUSC family protein [Mycobacterium sp. CPCC 205372]|uniref:FUSC family protein n=1 Tax=Mycobacterium hippophais TaxID=3016340 RepID=A0ABT4PWW0_9MYCO|nr:FUSC family protein [Mycobacterium hippophais]MCZ8381042.1 FUSC family protein [Mycobacterium hippophais]